MLWIVVSCTLLVLLIAMTLSALASKQPPAVNRTVYVSQQPPPTLSMPPVQYPAGAVPVIVSNKQPGPPDRPYVPTYGRSDFHQVGFVYQSTKDIRAPLYGRHAPRNPSRWQYYVAMNGEIRIGVKRNGVSCMQDIGCYELQTGDAVQVPELTDGDVVVSMYDVLSSQ